MSGTQPAPDFELPNVGPGPDPCSLAALADEESFVVLLFQDGHDCAECRSQAKRAGERFQALRARDAVAVSVLPEPRERAEAWQDRFQLPHPLLVDAAASVGDDYGQPDRLSVLGEWAPIFGRMPAVAVVDTRGPAPEVAWTYRGKSTWDHPSMTTVLDALDEVAEERPVARDVTVRPATPDDLTGVLGVLDAGALETDVGRVRASIDRGDAFVAVRSGADGEGETMLGALVLVDADEVDGHGDTAEIDAVAVRRGRRGQGIGRALVRAAAERYDRLVAEFDANVRPFYEPLGFAVTSVDGDGRVRGSLDCDER